MTTAANLWVAAAVGMAVGVGWIGLATVTTVLTFLLLRFGPRRAETAQKDGDE